MGHRARKPKTITEFRLLKFLGTSYNSSTVALEPGDVLVIFTDGVVEAENNQEEEYGDTRLLALLAANRRGSAADILKAVMGSVDTFVGDARQHDDLTCLVARVV